MTLYDRPWNGDSLGRRRKLDPTYTGTLKCQTVEDREEVGTKVKAEKPQKASGALLEL